MEGNADRPSAEGFVLRSDLALRAAFPHLETRVFEVSAGRYLICFPREALDAASVAERFHDDMRIITANVDVANDAPRQFVRELAPIADTDLARGFHGLPLTRFDIRNLLASHFPQADLLSVTDAKPGSVVLTLGGEPDPGMAAQLQIFCANFAAGYRIEVEFAGSAAVAADPPPRLEDPFQIVAHKLRPRAPRFVRDDEAYWFDNLDALYAGRDPAGGRPWSSEGGLSCLIDFSTGGRQLNLRQALMLYDTVFLTPPIAETSEAWARQQLSDADLLALVEAGRVRFVLTQPEERCDIRLLEAAHERNPAALLGRRTATAAVLSDLVETARKYRLADPRLRPFVGPASQALAAASDQPVEEVLWTMLWPTAALRRSVLDLMDRGVFGVVAFGQGEVLARQIRRATGRDVALETNVLSVNVHLAHALNATLIPQPDMPESWVRFSQLVGDRLNFYRNFDNRIAAAWVGNERRREVRRTVVPAVPLFEFDPDVPVQELLDATSWSSTRRKGRALLARLAELAPGERDEEVQALAAHLRRHRARQAGFFSLENLEDAGPVTGLILGVSSPPVFAIRNFVRRLVELGRGWAPIDTLADAFEQDAGHLLRGDEDLDFLSKVDRVAILKRPRVS